MLVNPALDASNLGTLFSIVSELVKDKDRNTSESDDQNKDDHKKAVGG